MAAKWDEFKASEANTKWSKYAEQESVPQDIGYIQKSGQEAITEGGKGFLSGLGGTYGNIQSLISRLLGVEQPRLTESQQLMAEAEANAPEWLQPWLQDEDIIPPISKLPTTSEVSKVLGAAERPETFAGRGGKRIGEMLGAGTALGINPIATAGRSALAGTAGQIAEELGLPVWAQALAEMAAFASPDLKRGVEALIKTTPQKTAEGLTLPKAALASEKQLAKAKVFSPQIAKAKERLTEQASNIINDIKETALPLTKEAALGVDIENKAAKLMENISAQAKLIPEEINTSPISKYLDGIEETINRIPVPAEEQKEVLKLLEPYIFEFGEGQTKSATELVNQYRAVNKNLRKIAETKGLYGSQTEKAKLWLGLNESIAKTFETELKEAPEFAKQFRFANEQYTQMKKIQKFESFMDSVSQDGVVNLKKLSSKVRQKSGRKDLVESLGRDNYQRIYKISNDLKVAEDKLSKIPGYNFGSLIKNAAIGGALKAMGLTLLLPAKGALEAVKIAKGYLLTSPQGTKDFSNFLKALSSGKTKYIEQAARTLENNFVKDYGNLEEETEN